MWPWNLTDDLEKQYDMFSMLFQALCIISQSSVNSNLCYSPETSNLGKKQRYFVMCDLEIGQMTLKNNRMHLPCYLKLCASFHSHQWIQTWVTVWKCSIWVKICNFLSHVTIKFNRWPCKTLGYLSYIMSSFVDHSIAIGKIKLELWSGNTIYGKHFFTSYFNDYIILLTQRIRCN